MYNFTNQYIPNCVGNDCFTCFYEGTVSEVLKLKNGKIAPVHEWNLVNNPCPVFGDGTDVNDRYDINGVPCINYNTDNNDYFTDRNSKIVVIKVTKIPDNR